MRTGKFPKQNDADESIPPLDGIQELTSENSYDSNSANFYTARQVGRWLGITPTRVRQLSQKHGIGKRTENYWIYTFEDIRLMGTLTREGKKPMRNVTPPKDPDLLLQQLDGQDELKRYMTAAWKQVRGDLRSFVYDVSLGLHNRLAQVEERYDRKIYLLEEMVKELRDELGKRREDGRGVPMLGGSAPLTLEHHEATEAAA